jgi:excisionase family DNA binding protein
MKLQTSRYRTTTLAPEPHDFEQIHQIEALLRFLSEKEHALFNRFGRQLEIPEELYDIMQIILKLLQEGRGVTIMPEDEQLTTQAAANILGVSRPFLVEQLLESGKIPYTYAASHRRIALADLLRYMRKRDKERHEAISEMTRSMEAAGVYDDEE